MYNIIHISLSFCCCLSCYRHAMIFLFVSPEPLSPPQSISISGGGDARLGDPLNLTCTADDNSDTSLLRFQWYKDREPLRETRSYLYLQEALPQDRGEYVCEVTVRNQIIQTAPLLVTLPGTYIKCFKIEISEPQLLRLRTAHDVRNMSFLMTDNYHNVIIIF